MKQTHYPRWKPVSLGSDSVWVRFKEGSPDQKAVIFTTGPVAIGPQFNPLFEALAKIYSGTLLAIETPGQGRFDKLRNRLDVSDYAGDLIRISSSVLGSSHPPETVFVGHCFGGNVVHEIAQKNLVAGTILLNPIDLVSISSLIGPTTALYARSKLSGLIDHFIAPDDLNSGAIAGLTSQRDVASVWNSRTYGPQKVGSHCAIVTGALDEQSPLSVVNKIAGIIGTDYVRVIEKVGHLIHLKAPEEVAQVIREFILTL